jgi:hypothetical protein
MLDNLFMSKNKHTHTKFLLPPSGPWLLVLMLLLPLDILQWNNFLPSLLARKLKKMKSKYLRSATCVCVGLTAAAAAAACMKFIFYAWHRDCSLLTVLAVVVVVGIHYSWRFRGKLICEAHGLCAISITPNVYPHCCLLLLLTII